MSATITDYRAFIASKGTATSSSGFAMHGKWPGLFPHQRATLRFACEKGRSAAFLDTGLGKSRVEAAAAAEFSQQSGKPSLILTPLAVARQMQRECAAVGVDARVIREQAEAGPGVNIANYERLPKLDCSAYGGVVLDESSILKAFSGPTKRMLCDAFASTPYRLAATATPAPNDHMELGNHSEFLGYLGSMEMLCRWFVNDTSTASQDWRLKGHARAAFWGWVASWARAATLPSDLGGDDAGFVLPPLTYDLHTVSADITVDVPEGMLFRIPDGSATAIHREKRLTMEDRVAKAAEIANAADGAVLTPIATHVSNLVFHENAFAFVTRPLVLPEVEQADRIVLGLDQGERPSCLDVGGIFQCRPGVGDPGEDAYEVDRLLTVGMGGQNAAAGVGQGAGGVGDVAAV